MIWARLVVGSVTTSESLVLWQAGCSNVAIAQRQERRYEEDQHVFSPTFLIKITGYDTVVTGKSIVCGSRTSKGVSQPPAPLANVPSHRNKRVRESSCEGMHPQPHDGDAARAYYSSHFTLQEQRPFSR
ncbi:hypothetical protein VTI74DRAFT_11653 [Chaetomium olivicolor]